MILAVLFLYPVGASIFQSFWNGSNLNIKGYAGLFTDCFIFYRLFWNSVFYASIITLVQLMVIIPCAFGFVYARFKGKHFLYVVYIMLMMMPLQVTILPNYIGLRDLNLMNHPLGIILPMVFSPFGVVVMHQFMKSMDASMIESARLDTSSMIRILWYTVIPQLRVCIYAVSLFIFCECWNMVEQPLIFVHENKFRTLSTMFSQADLFQPSILASAAVIFMIPVLLLFLLFNENLEEGLTLKELI